MNIENFSAKDSTDKDYNRAVSQAKTKQFSDFGKFMFATVGYVFYYRSIRLDKWEAWHISHNVEAMINGGVQNLKAVKRVYSEETN